MVVLLLELGLTRLFSVILWYHFAFMAISLALFGNAASGIVVYLFRDRLPTRLVPAFCSLALLLFSVVTVGAVWILLGTNLQPDVSWKGFRSLLLVYGLSSVPFFFAGFAIALVIAFGARQISRLYFFDLLGASLGCLLVIPLLSFLGGVNTILAIATLGAATAGIYALAARSRLLIAVSMVLGISFMIATWRNLGSEPWLRIQYAKGFAEKPGNFITRWNSFSRIAVSNKASTPRSPRFFSWGISRTYRGPKPSLRGVNIDAMAGTPITRYTGRDEEISYLRHDITSLAYYLKEEPRALVIGPGGGRDILAPLAMGAKAVTAVELNPLIVEFVQELFGDFSGRPYTLPNVDSHIDEGRAFVRKSPRRYDIIQASLVDTWAATAAGAFTLSENSLYTVEAFEDYFRHLEPGGIVTMSRFYTEPPRQTLRLVTIATEALLRLGKTDLARHVLIAKTPYYRDPKAFISTAIFGLDALDEAQIDKFHEVCMREEFEVIHSPRGPSHDFFSRLFGEGRQELLDGYEYDITPTTDDRPFFFNMLRPRDFLRVFSMDRDKGGFNLDAVFILVTILFVSMGLVLLLVVGPLLLDTLIRRQRPVGLLRTLPYFGSLGLGFILVEIALLQKYILLLGRPIYSLVVILFSLLLASGFGARWTRNRMLRQERHGARRVIAILIATGLLELLIYPVVFPFLIVSSTTVKIAAVVLMVFPMGFLMGMPLPLGIRATEREEPRLIPWAWSINGATSVLGTTLAFATAMNYGFTVALLSGFTVYALAIAVVGRDA